MIELTPAGAMMVYLTITLGALLGLWVFRHYLTRKKTALPDEYQLTVCEYCHFAYLVPVAKELTVCPQCRLLTKTKRGQA